MRTPLFLAAILTAAATVAQASPGPVPVPPTAPVEAPRDITFPGVISLNVDASDLDHRVVRVREAIPVAGRREITLLYPEWLPGTHAPEGPIDRLAGLVITVGGQPLSWRRDVANPFAFHVTIPAGTTRLDVAFQYLSPVADKVGPTEITSTIEILEWNALVLYPAGYFTRDIPVEASLTLPEGFAFASALDAEPGPAAGPVTRFKRAPLETVVDSPVYAGKYVARFDLDPGGPAPVRLNVFADKASELEIKPEQLAASRALVQQAYKLYGSHHYDHYDFLLSVSDLTEEQGLEHHRSSEDGVGAGYFADYDKAVSERTLLPHEYTHSWNGKFRRPADLWTPTYNVRMRDSLLWVYEGQTQYWGEVLSARSGLRTPAEERESLALIAAYYDTLPGRAWRPLQDTTNDEIINPRRPLSWSSWQRFEDYYDEGALIWLDADTLIRERSGGKRSMDDVAHAFFSVNDGSYTPVTYTFADLVAALNAVEPYDWAGFLRARLDGVGKGAPLDGLARAGYRLVYSDKPNLIQVSAESRAKPGSDSEGAKSFVYSLGFAVNGKGDLGEVRWESPAFKAGLTTGMRVIAVNGLPYDADTLIDALKAAETTTAPLELIVKTADRFKVVRIDYHGGLRYPHLEPIPGRPDLLEKILAPRS
jgi:predicted metalloprotease with PDZ domain